MSLIACNSPAFISRLFRLTGAISGPMVGLFLTGLYLPWVKGKVSDSGKKHVHKIAEATPQALLPQDGVISVYDYI